MTQYSAHRRNWKVLLIPCYYHLSLSLILLFALKDISLYVFSCTFRKYIQPIIWFNSQISSIFLNYLQFVRKKNFGCLQINSASMILNGTCNLFLIHSVSWCFNIGIGSGQDLVPSDNVLDLLDRWRRGNGLSWNVGMELPFGTA